MPAANRVSGLTSYKRWGTSLTPLYVRTRIQRFIRWWRYFGVVFKH